MAEVVSIGIVSDEQLASMENAGVQVTERVDLESLNLPEPQYGEAFVFHAEPEETAIFAELHTVTQQVEKMTRDLIADTMSEMGDKVRNSTTDEPWHTVLRKEGIAPDISDERGEKYFHLDQRRSFLHALLHWKLGERASAHGHRYGMRKPMSGDDRMRVYKLERRW